MTPYRYAMPETKLCPNRHKDTCHRGWHSMKRIYWRDPNAGQKPRGWICPPNEKGGCATILLDNGTTLTPDGGD